MKKNKKTRHRDLDVMLVPVDRRHQRRVRVYLSLLFVLMPVLTFFAGDFYARETQQSLGQEKQALQQKMVQLEAELLAARDELVLKRTDSEVSTQAQEKVRAEIKELRDQMAELEEAVAFYKSVMAPGSGESGLRIEKMDIAATTKPGEFSFRLVLTQVGDNRGYLGGNVTLLVNGRRGEEAVRLNGSEVLADGAETRFRFRYFQELSGRLVLPEGFEPDQLTVEATSTGRRQEKVERNFIWQVQERDSAWAG